MKAILEFTLPEDEDAFKLAQRGRDYYCALFDIEQILRDVRKYEKPYVKAIAEIEEVIRDVQMEDIR